MDSMKLQIHCMQCFQEKVFHEQSLPDILRLFQEKNIDALEEFLKKQAKLFQKAYFPISDVCDIDVRDDGIYELTCEEGHKTYTLLQQLLFEVLFDIGAYAITDGYYREAVSSFTASLERFYEFYIKVMSLKYGVSDEPHDSSWKLVSQQSERQLGAYIFLYTLENKISPKLLTNKNIEFRNNVIHKGKIPSKEETLKYGNTILNLVNPVLYALKKQNSEFVQQVVSKHFSAMRKKLPKDYKDHTFCATTIISISNTPHKEEFRTLEEEIESIDIRKKQYESNKAQKR